MKVKVKYTGLLSEIVGKHQEEVELKEGSTIEDLVRLLVVMHADLSQWLDKVLLLVIRVNDVEKTGCTTYRLKDNDVVELSTPLFEGG